MKFDSFIICAVFLAVTLSQTRTAMGAQQEFEVSSLQAATVISNVFPLFPSYRGMALFSAETDNFIPSWRKTNGWILFPLNGPTTSVQWKKSKDLVPYIPTFHITIQAFGTNQTDVTVRTIDAKVIHGKEIGVHGGWANHEVKIAPVLSEETNVLTAISNGIVLLRKQIKLLP